jgi:hypothetical protein|tara:strand:- start:240 stop:413 length:174 start_codon:yes stop_codon:yes gene_type:complete
MRVEVIARLMKIEENTRSIMVGGICESALWKSVNGVGAPGKRMRLAIYPGRKEIIKK